MFGYVTICEPELKRKDYRKYKAYYCGLCRTLKEKHGNLGQMTLSYDMTFAVILLTSLYESVTTEEEHRCKVHPLKKQKMLQNELTEYVADMNVLLAYYHMKDDWEDERKVSGLLGTKVLERKVEKLIKKYPRQSQVIKKELKQLVELEKSDSSDIDSTAGCFGRLLEEIVVYEKDLWEPRLRKIGFYLGKFIYIMDAYEDLEQDLKDGNYNPLKHLNKQQNYEEICHQMLCMMIAEATMQFEQLPCVLDIDILRNILYDGVWMKYRKLQQQKNISEEKKNDKESI